jgi:hypothetical protein
MNKFSWDNYEAVENHQALKREKAHFRRWLKEFNVLPLQIANKSHLWFGWVAGVIRLFKNFGFYILRRSSTRVEINRTAQIECLICT